VSSGQDFAHNGYAEQKRTEKAVAIESALAAEGLDSDACRAWDEDEQRWRITLPPKIRRRIEKAAGTRVASDETWLRALGFLADYEQTRKRVADEGWLDR
jgi:hypothetical protein